jgi:DNA-binding GntR family transcriptional regulator
MFLLTARLMPRERIGIDAVARELQVSATPVREALARLCAEGLLIRRHLAGYVMPDRLTPPELSRLLAFCTRLETWTAELAASAARRDLTERLAAILAEVDHADEDPEQALIGHETQFHLAVAALSGNDFAHSALATTHAYFHAYRSAQVVTAASISIVVDEHRAIATAITDGEAELSAALMEQHISAVANRLGTAPARR